MEELATENSSDDMFVTVLGSQISDCGYQEEPPTNDVSEKQLDLEIAQNGNSNQETRYAASESEGCSTNELSTQRIEASQHEKIEAIELTQPQNNELGTEYTRKEDQGEESWDTVTSCVQSEDPNEEVFTRGDLEESQLNHKPAKVKSKENFQNDQVHSVNFIGSQLETFGGSRTTVGISETSPSTAAPTPRVAVQFEPSDSLYSPPALTQHLDYRSKAELRKAELEALRRKKLATPQAAKLCKAAAPEDHSAFDKRQRALLDEQRQNERAARERLHQYRADEKSVLCHTTPRRSHRRVSDENESHIIPDVVASTYSSPIHPNITSRAARIPTGISMHERDSVRYSDVSLITFDEAPSQAPDLATHARPSSSPISPVSRSLGGPLSSPGTIRQNFEKTTSLDHVEKIRTSLVVGEAQLSPVYISNHLPRVSQSPTSMSAKSLGSPTGNSYESIQLWKSDDNEVSENNSIDPGCTPIISPPSNKVNEEPQTAIGTIIEGQTIQAQTSEQKSQATRRKRASQHEGRVFKMPTSYICASSSVSLGSYKFWANM